MKNFFSTYGLAAVLAMGCGDQEALVLHNAGADAAAVPDASPPLARDLVQQILNLSIECSGFPTIGDFERNFITPSCAMKIGTDGCHSRVTLFPPILIPPSGSESAIFERLLDKRRPGNPVCRDDKWIDSVNPSRSLMLVKVSSDDPLCSDGSPAGERMPRGMDALTDEQIRCMQAYVTTVSTWSRR